MQGMKPLKMTLIGLVAIAALSPSSLYAPMVTAQSGEMQVSPVRSTVNANPGDQEQVVITIKNTLQTAGTFNAVFRNFTSGDSETGEPRVVDDPGLAHGIQRWLSGPSSVAIKAGSSRDYTLNISVPAGTPTGTYYGLVLFSKQSSAGEAISASVGSLIFVNVGAITQKVVIEEFNTEGIKVSPTGMAEGEFVVRLKNTGNGYTVPKVVIEILDDHKSDVQTFNANEGMGGILPESIRRYTADFSRQLEPNKPVIARLTVTSENGESVAAEKIIAGNPPAAASASNSTPAANSETSNSKMPLLAGLIAGLLAITGAVVLVSRRRRKKSALSSVASPAQPVAAPLSQPGSNVPSRSQEPQAPEPPASPSETSQPDK